MKFKQRFPPNADQNPPFEAIHKITIRSSSTKEKRGSKPDLHHVLNRPCTTETSNRESDEEGKAKGDIQGNKHRPRNDPLQNQSSTTSNLDLDHPQNIIVIHKTNL
ncbi:hypothetical protein SESBI_23596 [Sesbania bispinosa]|nr:hypothetical protein SESBI_23596 [Sesbania bispinosa]